MPPVRDLHRVLSSSDWQRVVGHLNRARQEGLRNVVVDDVRRGRMSIRRFIWSAAHNCSPNAIPIYVVGLQRSGTNMLFGAFANTPEAEVYNESANSRAFFNWALRDDDVLRSLIESSRHRCIVFKPLCDSHRVVHLMEGLGVPRRGRSVWIYRDFADRVRSVFGHWPERTDSFGQRIANGFRGLETGGLSEERLAFATRFDPATMSRASGAALFWYLRNILFFDLELDQRPDVALISYDRFVLEPARFMTQLCDFAGLPFRRAMVHGVARRPPPTSVELDIDPRIASACDDLRKRLNDEFERRLAAGTLTGTRGR